MILYVSRGVVTSTPFLFSADGIIGKEAFVMLK
jgi:hypothetical protein